MALLDDLMKLEKQFWTGGPEFYRENVADRCLMVFDHYAGALDNSEVVETVQGERRWQDPDICVKGLIEPTTDFAILTYDVTVSRSNGEPYKAVASTGYVRKEGGWKLAFHQQTPAEGHGH